MFKINKLFFAVMLAIFATLPLMAGAQVPGADTRGDIRDARQTMSKERVKLLGDKAVLRLNAALNRADGFRERVALHASQFSNPKFNKATVDQKLVEAADAIAKGRTAVAAIKTAVDKALAGTGTEISFVDVRAKIREAMASIRTAHLKIVDAIKLIKATYPTPPAGGPGATTTTQ